jgi:hypothetical protein
MRKILTRPGVIVLLFVVQFVPLVIFPASSYAITTQEWWLPVLISVMALIATLQLLRNRLVMWPWYILNFAQGTNIISRLMMLMPHASVNVEGQIRLNTPYVALTFVSILLSAFFIWYFELVEVRRAVATRFAPARPQTQDQKPA